MEAHTDRMLSGGNNKTAKDKVGADDGHFGVIEVRLPAAVIADLAKYGKARRS